LISFNGENAEVVKKLAEIAKENGRIYHEVDMGIPEEDMYSLAIHDLDEDARFDS
jgi:predicted lactoylglutathione lyase